MKDITDFESVKLIEYPIIFIKYRELGFMEQKKPLNEKLVEYIWNTLTDEEKEYNDKLSIRNDLYGLVNTGFGSYGLIKVGFDIYEGDKLIDKFNFL